MSEVTHCVSVILAAGASTRMKSRRSKLLHSVLGRPLIHWSIDLAGWISDKIVAVVGHQKEELIAAIEPLNAENSFRFAIQAQALGTGHAVQCAWKEIEEVSTPESMVFIMAGDAFLLKRESLEAFVEHHQATKAQLSVMTFESRDPGAYGRILRNSQGQIERIIEKKDATADQLKIREVNSGFYLVNRAILQEALKSLDNKNQAKEFYLTDLVPFCRKVGHLVQTFLISEEEGLGVNTQNDLAMVTRIMRDRINEWWMLNGVHMQAPETTWIETDVQLAPDVTIAPGVLIKGRSKIQSGVQLGAYSVIEDCEIGESVVVEPYSHLHQAKVGAESRVGPFARLRPGAQLDRRVHIGNFVEVKKSHMSEGSKANHLAYIGDAEVGRESNIGAGTITCNYDGISKHPTKIGDRVFIGSNTSLVAPVEIATGAMVGAGSVISKNVPADALAVERADQRVIEQGAAKFRQRKSRG